MTRKSRRQIVATPEGANVPEALVDACVGHWQEFSEIQIKRRGGRRWKAACSPVAITSKDEASDLDVQESTPEEAASEAYDAARTICEHEGPETFVFVGWLATGPRTGEEVFTVSLAIDADEEGGLDAVEDMTGEGSTLNQLSKTVRELSQEIGRVHKQQADFLRSSFHHLEDLRSSQQVHVQERISMARDSAEQEAGVWEIQERTARAEAAGQTLGSLMEHIGPQLAAALAAWTAGQDRPQGAPGPAPTPGGPTPPSETEAPPVVLCEASGTLDRVLSRVPPDRLAAFRAQFSDQEWAIWSRARSATKPADFDQAVIELLQGRGILDQQKAQAAIVGWAQGLPQAELIHLGPIFMASSSRIAWPITPSA